MMDKNQSVIALVVIVFIIVVAMIYTLSVSNRRGITEEELLQGTEETFGEGQVLDVNVDTDANSINEDIQELVANNNVEKDVVLQNVALEKKQDYTAPQTGPGLFLVLIAGVLAAISATFVFKTTSK